MKRKPTLTSLQFFAKLKWLDGRPLLDTIEPYRRRLFTAALDTFREDGAPVYNMALIGRGKKNWKSADLVLASLFCVTVRRSIQGSAALILANDEGQAGDDLSLAKKLVERNAELGAEFEVLQKELRLRDGSGSIRILPAGDASGLHGKTYAFVGFDEIHAYRDWAVLEALQPDPTRPDALTWITSYDTIYSAPGVPLYDLKQIGFAGSDPRMLFSWYSGDECTDPTFAELEPELRANPSMSSWPEGAAYLAQQKRRLPFHKYRRLHLNLPGAPSGAFLDQGRVLAAIVPGRRALPPQPGIQYRAFVDMSGGSSDDAVLCIAHAEDRVAIIDLVEKQAGGVPFNPRDAVLRFVGLLKTFGISAVTGDNYAGETFKADFEAARIRYDASPLNKTQLYEAFEPALNAGEVELPDLPKLQEQLLTLVVKGARIDAEKNGHDDFANAVCGAAWLVREPPPMIITREMVAEVAAQGAMRRRMSGADLYGERRFLQMQMRRGRSY
jgi:hypothetical protein